MSKKLPDHSTLKRLLEYSTISGKLYWKHRSVSEFQTGNKFSAEANCARWNTRFAGKEAFTAVERRRGEPRGHKVGILHGVRYKAHRVIWKLINGVEPLSIDHIDGNPENNRLDNLRSVKHQDNTKNQRIRATNTSGVNGVRWDKARNKWLAKGREGNKHFYLGRFDSFQDACEARAAFDKQQGYHQNHGKTRA
jgi:hypothetical protein